MPNTANAPLLRQQPTVLENSDCATPWPSQWMSAGACQNGTDSTLASVSRSSKPPSSIGSCSRNEMRAGSGVSSAMACCKISKRPPSAALQIHMITKLHAP